VGEWVHEMVGPKQSGGYKEKNWRVQLPHTVGSNKGRGSLQNLNHPGVTVTGDRLRQVMQKKHVSTNVFGWGGLGAQKAKDLTATGRFWGSKTDGRVFQRSVRGVEKAKAAERCGGK